MVMALILEIGSMFGLLLDELRKEFFVFGIELAKSPFAEIQKKGIGCYNGAIEDFSESNDIKFDTIISTHVIEHTDNVRSFISAIKKNLKKNGTLIIVSPNFERSHKLKHNWGWNLVPAHQYHFDEKYLKTLLNKFNFKVLNVYTKGGDAAFYLSCIYNFLNIKKGKLINLTISKFILLFTFFFVSKPLYHLRKDELIIVAKNIKAN